MKGVLNEAATTADACASERPWRGQELLSSQALKQPTRRAPSLLWMAALPCFNQAVCRDIYRYLPDWLDGIHKPKSSAPRLRWNQVPPY